MNENKIFFAKQEFEKVLAIDSNHKGARKYLSRINGIINEMNQYFIIQGEELYNRRLYRDALAQFEKILVIDSSNTSAFSKIQLCKDKIEEEKSNEQNSIIENYKKQAETLHSEGRIEKSLEIYNKALLLDTSNQAVIDNIRKTKNELSDSYYKRAIELTDKQSFLEAHNILQKSKELNPENKNALKLNDKLKKEADTLYDRGFEEFTKGNKEKAIIFWEDALALDPEHKKTLRALERHKNWIHDKNFQE